MGHSAFAFWFWVVGDHPSRISSHVSSQSVTSVKAVVARGAVAACNGAATRSGRPRQPTHHAQWEAIAHDRASRRKQLAAQMGGGRIPHTPEQHSHLTRERSLDVAGSPLGPISPFHRRRAATRRAEPVSAGDLGAARAAPGVRDGSVGSVPKADRLGCELRQPVGGRDGWPRAGGGEGVRR